MSYSQIFLSWEARAFPCNQA